METVLMFLDNYAERDSGLDYAKNVRVYNQSESTESFDTVRMKYAFARRCVITIQRFLPKCVTDKDNIVKHENSDLDYQKLVEILSGDKTFKLDSVVMIDTKKCKISVSTDTRNAWFIIDNLSILEYFTESTNTLNLQ